jgi:hypothetical protein
MQVKGAQVERPHTKATIYPSEARHSGLQGERSKQKRGSHKRPSRVWRPKRTKHRLVMGMDVILEEACNLALCALVGRLTYRSCCKQTLTDWMQCNWEPVLGYSPEVMSLSRGWLGFVFKSSGRLNENFRKVLGLWGWDPDVEEVVQLVLIRRHSTSASTTSGSFFRDYPFRCGMLKHWR